MDSIMASRQYKISLINLLQGEDPSLDKIIQYYQLISQKKLQINLTFINLIEAYIYYRQAGFPHQEAVVMARHIALGVDNKFCKTKKRLKNKLAARLK